MYAPDRAGEGLSHLTRMKKQLVILVFAMLLAGGCASSVNYVSQTQNTPQIGDGRGRKVLKEVQPRYPARLQRQGVSGVVIVRVWVQPDGTVSEAYARKGQPELCPLATAAVRQWRFSPAPEESIYEVTMNFSLNDPKIAP